MQVFNQLARSRRKRSLQGERGLRERTAHAVLRMLGGKLQADEVGEEIADMLDGGAGDVVLFDRRERVMISGVLSLADAVPLVRLRAQAMQDAVPVGAGAAGVAPGCAARAASINCWLRCWTSWPGW